MSEINKLKRMIDEENYPFFDEVELRDMLKESRDINKLARDLCIVKAGILEIKIGDIEIPSPRDHFLTMASKYRQSRTGRVGRADEC